MILFCSLSIFMERQIWHFKITLVQYLWTYLFEKFGEIDFKVPVVQIEKKI